MATKEHSSAAATEGWANFYAALAFNRTDESDCAFMYNKNQDFDRDGVNDSIGGTDSISCEASPIWDPVAVPSDDYLGNLCDTPYAHRSVELDWMRFFWDLTTDQDVSFSDLGDLWDIANPRTWNAVGVNGSSSNPWPRIEAAALDPALDLSSEVAAESHNGVDR